MPIKINISGDKLAVPKRIRRALYHKRRNCKTAAGGWQGLTGAGTQICPRRLTFMFCVLLLAGATTFGSPAPDELYRGWLAMYDLNFQDAHQRISLWEATHPDSAMGPTSQATAYLFAELARLGVLESELFVDNDRFRNRERINPDPEAKRLFMEQIREADDLASRALALSPGDVDALLAESIALGLRADYDSLIEKKTLTPLEYTKRSREYAERLLSVHPDIYDAYLGPGVENYILSQKAAPVRFFLRLKGAQVDHDKGIDRLATTAAHGHYLEPFAKLLLAVAALRDNNPSEAARLLQELHQRFPHNSLYVRELDRIAHSG